MYIYKNYKSFVKEIKELNKWKDTQYSWIERLDIVKMSALPNLIYNSNEIPVKIQQVILWLSTNWFLSLHAEAKDKNSHHNTEGEQS